MSVFLKILLISALILAIPAAFLGWQAYTHSTSYLLAKGDRAAEEGKHDEVERLAKLLEKKGEINAAEVLRALLKRHPDNKDAHRFLSVIYIDLNSPSEAIKHLEEWARLDPTNGLPHRWIGFFRRDNNQVSEAIDGYEQALKRQLTPQV